MNHTPRIYCYLCATKLERKSEFSFYCPSCDYVQYESPKPGVEIILRRNGKILISERAGEPDKGKFDMPGGFIEPFETAEEAALREANEELGIVPASVTNIQYLNTFYTHYAYEKEVYAVLTTVFVADLGEDTVIEAQDDVASVRWIDGTDLEDIAWSREVHRANARQVLD